MVKVPVKDLDPGRGWIHCVYGSDHPLIIMTMSKVRGPGVEARAAT